VVVFQDHRESEDEVEDVVDGETGEVAIRRGLHRLARHNDDVDDVADAAERDDWRDEHLEGYRLDDVEKQSTLRQRRVVVPLMMFLVCPRRVQHTEAVTDVDRLSV